ncbi:MAG: restriction endonuclease subunit S [Kiritimatiellae bacterium]|nr:restriction endonuclease subunit S [Kiritimatiellia bacterium]
MSKWVTLNDLGYVNRGRSKHRPRNAPELYGGQYPFVQTADIKHAGLYLNEYGQTYSQKGLEQSRLWPVGTLCITIAANIADTAILGCEACFPDSIIGFIPDEDKCDVRYVKYLFDTQLQTAFQQLSQGVAQDNLSKDKLLSIKFCVPDLLVQRQIADILSAYDDLIENNRRRIAILEETARLAYRKWFGGMEQGRTATLGDVLETIESGSRPRGGAVNDGVPSIGAEKIESIGVYDYSSEKFVSREYYDKMRRGKIRSGDVLLYKDGAYTGKVSMALNGFPHAEAAVNEHVFILRTRNLHAQCFLYCFLRQQEIYDKINTIASAKACQPGLNQSDVLNLEIEVPTDDEIGRFENRVIPLFDEIVNFAKQNAALVTARDMLLPRLMKGDLMRLDMSDTDTTRCESRVQIPPFPNRGCVSDFGGAL